MTAVTLTPRTATIAAVAVLASLAIGFGVARLTDHPASTSTAAPESRKVLYWYDPMIPNEHHDGPGLSSMGMKLIPKYAGDGGAGAPGVRIDPAAVQNLGARTVAAAFGTLPSGITATGTVDFNERDVAIVQARAGGFVERVYGLAPDDVIRAGVPIADVLVPDWGGAQQEYLAVRGTGDAALARAARQRLVLLGMPPAQIAAVGRSGRVHTMTTIRTPVGGMVKTLGVRQGMTLNAGQTLAEIDGLATVWVNAALPETLASRVNVGTHATVTITAFPGETFSGRVTAILPQADVASRTLTARIEITNRGGRLRPGMFATAAFTDRERTALLVPSDAVIRTGTRNLVMLAGKDGRYRPAEVRIGATAAGQTEILAGLAPGERVVASGQFLIDSEASLADVPARPIDAAPKQPDGAAAAGRPSGTEGGR